MLVNYHIISTFQIYETGYDSRYYSLWVYLCNTSTFGRLHGLCHCCPPISPHHFPNFHSNCRRIPAIDAVKLVAHYHVNCAHMATRTHGRGRSGATAIVCDVVVNACVRLCARTHNHRAEYIIRIWNRIARMRTHTDQVYGGIFTRILCAACWISNTQQYHRRTNVVVFSFVASIFAGHVLFVKLPDACSELCGFLKYSAEEGIQVVIRLQFACDSSRFVNVLTISRMKCVLWCASAIRCTPWNILQTRGVTGILHVCN